MLNAGLIVKWVILMAGRLDLGMRFMKLTGIMFREHPVSFFMKVNCN